MLWVFFYLLIVFAFLFVSRLDLTTERKYGFYTVVGIVLVLVTAIGMITVR